MLVRRSCDAPSEDDPSFIGEQAENQNNSLMPGRYTCIILLMNRHSGLLMSLL